MATNSLMETANVAAGERSTAAVGASGSASELRRGAEQIRGGEIDAAIATFEKAVKLDPENTEAIFRLAYALDLRGDDDRAIELYESLTAQSDPSVNALLNLAVLYEDREEHEDAIACCERVLATHPNHARARLFLKDALSSLNMHYDEDMERVREKHNAILDIPVSDFELSVRSRNCLKKMNINSLGDLLRISEQELLSYKNFGETSLNEIKAMLKLKGLHLGQVAQTTGTRPAPVLHPAPVGVSPDILNKPVSELELSVRSRKCLQRLNINTVGDLAARTEAELLGTKNFGQTSLSEVKQRLNENGLSLRTLDDAPQ